MMSSCLARPPLTLLLSLDMDNGFIEDGEGYTSDSEESKCSEMEEEDKEEGDYDDTVVL